MLATLNLQLLPATLSDEAPGVTGTGDAEQPAFTDLLRMRIDATGSDSGDVLPDTGNDLPLAPPILPTADLSFDPDLAELPDATVLEAESASIELDVTVDYPQEGFVVTDPDGASLSAAANVSTVQNLAGQESSAIETERPPAIDIDLMPPIPLAVSGTTTDFVSPSPGIEKPLAPNPLTAKEKGQPSLSFAAVATEPGDDIPDSQDTPRLAGTGTLPAVHGATDIAMVEQPLVKPLQSGPAAAVLPHAGLAAVSQHTSAESPPGVAAPSMNDVINTPVRDHSWGERIGERVLMMAGKHLQSAQIRLTPADLGPVRVHVSVDEGSTNVSFHVQHTLTREALEQALPRLREMLSDSGLSLGQASVNDSGVSTGNQDQGSAGGSSTRAGDSPDRSPIHDEPRARQKVVIRNGLIDTFA